MELYTAKNKNALGMCLRILSAEGYKTVEVETKFDEKQKIRFHIHLNESIDEQETARLKRMFDNMTS